MPPLFSSSTSARRCASSAAAWNSWLPTTPPAGAAGGVDVHIGMLEQALRELLRENPHDGAVESRLGQFPRVYGFDEQVRAFSAAELIDAGLDRFHEARAHRQVLDPPRHAHVGKAGTLTGGRAFSSRPRADL